MRRMLTILIIVILFVPTGCWNAREINELAFVIGLAVDKDEKGQIKVTVQMARPDAQGKASSGGGGGGGGGGAQNQKPFWVASASGNTLFEAIRNMAEFSSRRIFWSHNKAIIISDALARDDITDILDFFSRNPELRLRTWIAVTPGKAGPILEENFKPAMEKDPSSTLERIIERRDITGKGSAIMLKDFLEDYLNPLTNPVASRLVFSPKQAHRLSGTAVFKKSKMVGWLDEKETNGLLWLKGQIKTPVMVIKCPFDGKPLSIEIVGAKVNNKSSIKDGRSLMDITVKATGNLTEQSCETDFNQMENRQALKKALESTVKDNMTTTVQAAQQKFGFDFLDFSEIFLRQHKKEWQQMLSQNPEVFKETKVSIRVKANIPREGLFAKPLKVEVR